MIIDCDRCAIRGIGCSDCVISVLLEPPPIVELDEPELRALGTLADAGLVPRLRLVPMDGSAETSSGAKVGQPSAERSAPRVGRYRRQVS